MSASIASKTTHAYSAETFAVPESRRSAGVGRALARFAVACGFAVFCCLTLVAAWYSALAFQNESYRAVVIFLAVIVISNVASKYVIWRMKEADGRQ